MSNVLWVDENDNVLGEVSREKAHAEGLLHRVSAIYLVNKKGEILVNERAKDGYLDHSSAGHVEIGESYLEAARRELKEELGVINVELTEMGSAQEMSSLDKYGNKVRRHIFRIFLANAEFGELNKEEVKSVFWADPNWVYSDMQKNPEKYTNGFKETIKVFLDSRR